MRSVTLHAITVLGHDRPGIIAETTRELARLGLNLEDSSMTLLRGHFAMTLVCEGEASDDAIRDALAPLSADGLTVTVHQVPAEELATPTGSSWVLTVHGGDRPGIVSAVVSEIAAARGNITDLTTRLAGELYLLIAEVDLPAGADPSAVAAALAAVGEELGIGVTWRQAEADDL